MYRIKGNLCGSSNSQFKILCIFFKKRTQDQLHNFTGLEDVSGLRSIHFCIKYLLHTNVFF